MKIYIDINASADQSLIVDRLDTTQSQMPPLFYGDKFKLEVYPVNASQNPTWFGQSKLYLAIGTFGNHILQSTEGTFDGEKYFWNLDLNTTEFSDLTSTKESVQQLFEIQLSNTNGTSRTLLHKQVEIRNQLLGYQTFSLTIPNKPILGAYFIVPEPQAPTEIIARTTPKAPSFVVPFTRSVTGQPRNPYAPFDVFAEIATAPENPSDVEVQFSPYPTEVEWNKRI